MTYCRTGCCIALALMVACGRIPEPAGPVYEIVVSRIATPAGTEHVQVFVPAGVFKMGAAGGEADEQPVHEVELDAFYMDQYQVTNALYMAFVAATGGEPPTFIEHEAYNQPQQPAVGIPWSHARDYCAWAGLQLPTEAQWEKAAGGTDGRFYPWGNEAPDNTRANFNFHAEGPMPVGSHPDGASPYGAHDMAGNVWEWVLDEYSPDFYAQSPKKNPVNLASSGLEDGPDRTLRGGGWISPEQELRVSVRNTIFKLSQSQPGGDFYSVQVSLGFRCVRVMR